MTDKVDAEPARDTDVLEIRMPAHSAYLSVVRTTAATLAARLDFTLDEIEDLRIAVGEASTALLGQAAPDSEVTCQFRLSGTTLTVCAACTLDPDLRPTSPADEPSPVIRRDSFAWTVLSALVDSADEAPASPGQAAIELVKTATMAHADAASRPALHPVPSGDALEAAAGTTGDEHPGRDHEADSHGHESTR